METNQQKVISTFSPRKVFIAISIGLVFTGYLFYQSITDPKNGGLEGMIHALSNPNWGWFFASIFVLLLRDSIYMYRIYNLTQKELSIKGSVYTILLWEFASPITPSVVAGTAVADFILAKEGIKLGKALAYVMLTAILDNSFFLLVAPIALLTTKSDIFAVLGQRSFLGLPLRVEVIFYSSYFLIAIYTFIMAYGLLINPRGFKWILLKLTSVSFLRRWRGAAYEQTQEMFLASGQLNNNGYGYWVKAITSTFLIWCARYLMLNCLITAFGTGVEFSNQFDIFAKQVILWIVQLLSPTPGGAGLAETFFDLFFRGSGYGPDSLWVPLAFLWRVFTYYTYLIAGVIVFPKWLKKVS